MLAILDELVIDPAAPGIPWVLTSIAFEEKNTAGPEAARDVGAVAVTAVAAPPTGSVTAGPAAQLVFVGGSVHGRVTTGPPKRLTWRR